MYVPDRNLDPPPDPPLVCTKCGGPFLYGDLILRDIPDILCLDCFKDFAQDLLDNDPSELAERLRFDVDKQGKEI